MNTQRKNASIRLTRAAIIAALYVVLTYLSSIVGLSSGVIQVRLSEMLCIMPLFFPEAIAGLYIGCTLANILTGSLALDVIFGSIATLLGATGAYLLKKFKGKLVWVTTLPTVIANALIVPPILIYTYGAEESFLFIMLTVGAGELISATIFGTALFFSLKRKNILH